MKNLAYKKNGGFGIISEKSAALTAKKFYLSKKKTNFELLN